MFPQFNSYISAEFQLEVPGIYYQFKLRKSESEPLFVLISQNSRALMRFKAGDIIPMTYHHKDKTIPPEKKQTLIKYVVDGNIIGVKNHTMVALDILMNYSINEKLPADTLHCEPC